ncbi:MAG TPA: hypothetical protein VMU99_01085 [Acidimicrobiales bacterium]|nr:hypothetical protein [Acidimicrobiales bacterium]
MDIVRNADGTLVVPVQHERPDVTENNTDISSNAAETAATRTDALLSTRVLHPGEGGYDEALAEWDLQQNPGREPVISTATGREQAMTLVHAIATSPDHAVASAIETLQDPKASGEALRFVLIGGVHSVEAFATEVAEAKGGDPIPAHQMTKIIGEVLAKLDE